MAVKDKNISEERIALAARLKALRTMREWRQEDVAKRLGWSVNSYGDIELLRKRVYTQQLLELATLFDVTPGWLLLGQRGDMKKFMLDAIDNSILFNMK